MVTKLCTISAFLEEDRKQGHTAVKAAFIRTSLVFVGNIGAPVLV